MEKCMESSRKYVPRSRDADEIARDIDRTQTRIDATLKALQGKLKPSNLAKDAAQRLAGSGARSVRQLAERLIASKEGVRARELVDEAKRTIAELPPGDAAMLTASARLAAARFMADRARRGEMIRLGAAALGTVLAAAAVAALTNGSKKRRVSTRTKPAVRGNRATKAGVRSKRPSKSRRVRRRKATTKSRRG